MIKTIKILLVIILIVCAYIWYVAWKNANPDTVENLLVPSPTPAKVTGYLGLAENESNLMNLDSGMGSFRIAWEVVADTTKVAVGINQELEFSSQQLMDKLSCRVLTSGAFYDTANQPLGLLVDQGATLSAWRPNQLLHGLVGFDLISQKIVVTKEPQDFDFEWAVQAGPMLWQDGQQLSLNLSADQAARRIIAGVTDQGQLVLLTIVAKDSLYGGPKLVDVASILQSWQEQTKINLMAALNLDGGTASAFLSPTLKLKELKPIGSYICVE